MDYVSSTVCIHGLLAVLGIWKASWNPSYSCMISSWCHLGWASFVTTQGLAPFSLAGAQGLCSELEPAKRLKGVFNQHVTQENVKCWDLLHMYFLIAYEHNWVNYLGISTCVPGRGTCAWVCWSCAAENITCLGENECVYPSAKERRKKEQVNLPQRADYAFSTSNCQHLFNYFTHYKCALQPLTQNPSLLLSAPLEVTRSFLMLKSLCGRHLLPGQGLSCWGNTALPWQGSSSPCAALSEPRNPSRDWGESSMG